MTFLGSFLGVWYWPTGLFLGITICLHAHIPVTIIPEYRKTIFAELSSKKI